MKLRFPFEMFFNVALVIRHIPNASENSKVTTAVFAKVNSKVLLGADVAKGADARNRMSAIGSDFKVQTHGSFQPFLIIQYILCALCKPRGAAVLLSRDSAHGLLRSQ